MNRNYIVKVGNKVQRNLSLAEARDVVSRWYDNAFPGPVVPSVWRVTASGKVVFVG